MAALGFWGRRIFAALALGSYTAFATDRTRLDAAGLSDK